MWGFPRTWLSEAEHNPLTERASSATWNAQSTYTELGRNPDMNNDLSAAPFLAAAFLLLLYVSFTRHEAMVFASLLLLCLPSNNVQHEFQRWLIVITFPQKKRDWWFYIRGDNVIVNIHIIKKRAHMHTETPPVAAQRSAPAAREGEKTGVMMPLYNGRESRAG